MHSRVDQCHQEMAYELVRTAHPAEMLCSRRLQIGRIPARDAQLAGVFRSNKPMIRLAFLRSADIACYDLSDHRSPFRSEEPNSRSLGGLHRNDALSLQQAIVFRTLRGCARELPSVQPKLISLF